MGKHDRYPYTTQLRGNLDELGIFYTTGYCLADNRIMEGSITNVWASDQSRLVTIEEHEDGGLRCADPITTQEVLRMLGYGEGES